MYKISEEMLVKEVLKMPLHSFLNMNAKGLRIEDMVRNTITMIAQSPENNPTEELRIYSIKEIKKYIHIKIEWKKPSKKILTQEILELKQKLKLALEKPKSVSKKNIEAALRDLEQNHKTKKNKQ